MTDKHDTDAAALFYGSASVGKTDLSRFLNTDVVAVAGDVHPKFETIDSDEARLIAGSVAQAISNPEVRFPTLGTVAAGDAAVGDNLGSTETRGLDASSAHEDIDLRQPACAPSEIPSLPADRHIMVDLETLGTTPGSVILSIGAVVFDPITGDFEGIFYHNIDRLSCLTAGLTEDPKTVQWWEEQSDEAKAVLLPDQVRLRAALTDFSNFWERHHGKYLWSHGPSFDESILSAAYRALSMMPPWHHSDVRCTRTIYDLAGVWPNRDVGTPHCALDDARNQVVAVLDAYKKLRPAIIETAETGAATRFSAYPWSEAHQFKTWPPHIPMPSVIANYCTEIHADNVRAGWWSDLKTGERITRSVGEMLMLVVSEIREGWQGLHGGLKDDKLPHREMLEVELADALIREYDIAGAHGLDIAGAVAELLMFDVLEGRRDGVFMQIIDEICDAMEGHRKGTMSTRLPHRSAFELGLAAALIRIYDMGNMFGYDLTAAIAEKRAFNATRADHKPENRAAPGGKAY